MSTHVGDPRWDPLNDPLDGPAPAQAPAPAADRPAPEPEPTREVPVLTQRYEPPVVPGFEPRPAPLPVPPPAPHPVVLAVPEPDGGPASAEDGVPLPVPTTASDFIGQRQRATGDGPATWGWRGWMNYWSGGLLAFPMGADETEHRQLRATVQRDLGGPRTIAFINPKGGAAKTTGVLAAGHGFGTVRGGGVVAWDNNETRGTLGLRGMPGPHRNTTRELLEELAGSPRWDRAGIGDLAGYVRRQGDAHFDLLASDERPDVAGMVRGEDFARVHRVLQRFYQLILIDTGNNIRSDNWLAAAETADLLVVTSTVNEDTGYSGLWMLDALEESGLTGVRERAVTVLSDTAPRVDRELAEDLVQVYSRRTRAVYRVPYDPVLVSGAAVPYAHLSRGTRRAWLRACAGMAEAL